MSNQQFNWLIVWPKRFTLSASFVASFVNYYLFFTQNMLKTNSNFSLKQLTLRENFFVQN